MTDTCADVFENIAKFRLWGPGESVSGDGSSIGRTAVLRPKLAETFERLNIRSVVDAPCGDMNWMRHIEYDFEKFIGVDIVPQLIRDLRSTLQSEAPFRHFQAGDITRDILPAADAIICRDCLVHLPFADAQRAAKLWKAAGFRWAFVTTFTQRRENADCNVGDWRPLNMQAAPFNWGEPVVILDEGHAPPFEDKAIAVWDVRRWP